MGEESLTILSFICNMEKKTVNKDREVRVIFSILKKGDNIQRNN